MHTVYTEYVMHVLCVIYIMHIVYIIYIGVYSIYHLQSLYYELLVHIIYDIIYQLFSISYYINHKNDRPPQPRSDPCHLSKLATRLSRCHPQACVCQIFFNGQEVFVAASIVVPTKSPSHWLSFGLSPSQDASHK